MDRNQVVVIRESTGHSLSHSRHLSLFWSRHAGTSTPSSDLPGSVSTSRGQQRAQNEENQRNVIKNYSRNYTEFS